MKQDKKIKRLDYFPIIALFLFWFFSAFVGSVEISRESGHWGYTLLGFVTLPAIVLTTLAAIKIKKLHSEKDSGNEE